MKYPKEYLEEIKSRLKVSTVVSKFVAIKKRGKELTQTSLFPLFVSSYLCHKINSIRLFALK